MSQENVEIVRRMYDAFLRGDREAARAVLDPEVEWDARHHRGRWPHGSPIGSSPPQATMEVPMHARVVRFTDVSPERIDKIVSQTQEADGPPEGIDSTGFQLLVDEQQGTAIFIGLFEDEQKMRDADAIFQQMDPTDTPGTRASVDQCEIRVERHM
ncbi:MAG TPA: hypothetical protein VJT75_05175 [Thermoleophilaceae bacterium]|nr:hypothetical protein [Thermoleophilaceae bacterium]